MSLEPCWVQPPRCARTRSEDRPRGETIDEEERPSAAAGEDYLLTNTGPIRVGRRPTTLGAEFIELGNRLDLTGLVIPEADAGLEGVGVSLVR